MVDPFVALSRFLFDQALSLDASKGETRQPDWPSGTRLDALVRAVAEPSRALLQIGNQLVDAKLPAPAQPGDRLTLRVVEPYPRLVFALESQDAQAAGGRTQVVLSGAARVLGDLAAREGSSSPGRPLALTQTIPMPMPTSDSPHAEAIANHLKQSVERSGLFYERHQARWVMGDYALSDLKQEPQAQHATPVRVPVREHLEPAREAPSGPRELPHAPANGEHEPPPPRPASDARPAAEMPLRGQMELLDGRTLPVTMPAWAGREMHWELPEREPQADDSQPPAWSTRLAVDLPLLGAVRAHLRISGNGLALAVDTDFPESAQQLARAQGELMQSLRDAGIDLIQLNIAAADE